MGQKVHPKGFRLRSTGNNAPRFKVPNWKAKPSDRIPSVSNSNSSIQVSSENLQNEVLQNTINGTHQCET